jgi:hypothetical protein
MLPSAAGLTVTRWPGRSSLSPEAAKAAAPKSSTVPSSRKTLPDRVPGSKPRTVACVVAPLSGGGPPGGRPGWPAWRVTRWVAWVACLAGYPVAGSGGWRLGGPRGVGWVAGGAGQRSPGLLRSAVWMIRSISCGSGSPVAAHISGNADAEVMPGIVLISLRMISPAGV